MTDTWILYKTTNLINGKIYVGVHKLADTSKSRNYIGSGLSLKSAIEKYGKKNFTRATLAEFNSIENAYIAEAELVTQEFVDRSDTYNISLGGRGGGIQTPEMRAKNSASKKGRKYSEEHRKKMSDYQKSRSKEDRAKVGATQKGKIISLETRAKIGAASRGRKHTPESKAKMSIAQLGNKKGLGKTHTPEARAKISAANKGKIVSVETRKKLIGENNPMSVAVVINGIYYSTRKFAAEAENVSPPTVSNRIKNIKSEWVGWRFATEAEIASFSAREVAEVQKLSDNVEHHT
jgi:group I intron endonuclease